MKTSRNNYGFASILALLLLAIFATLSISFVAATNGSMLQADNQKRVAEAQLAAESGMAFHTYLLRQLTIPGDVQGQSLMNALNASLSSRPQLIGNLGGAGLTYTGSVINIPAISLGSQSFDASLFCLAGTTATLKVTGHSGAVSRCVTIDCALEKSGAPCPAAGIVTRGAVTLTGNDQLKSANTTSPCDEASIFTAASAQTVLTLTGNAKIQGDVYATNANGQASTSGNISIGGASGAGAANHIHFGTPPVDIPEVDPTVFAPFATNIVDGSTSTVGNKTFTNIRIKANTNPNFSGNITLKGVVYIEKPNKVTFTGNLNFTGLIVSDTGHDTTNNQINFTGNTSTSGVEDLLDSDAPNFHDLKQLPGAFLLAPGFVTKFTGNFGTVNGMMVAEGFTFTGNAGGTIRGSIINYGTSTFSMSGNSTLIFDHSEYTGAIPGLAGRPKFVINSLSYLETSR